MHRALKVAASEGSFGDSTMSKPIRVKLVLR